MPQPDPGSFLDARPDVSLAPCRDRPECTTRWASTSRRARSSPRRVNVPDAEFIEGDAASLDFGEDSFDAVVSFYMLEHIPRAEHARLLSRIFGWLRSAGYLLMSVEEAEEPGTIAEWLGVPMFFSSFAADTVVGMVRDGGFEVVRAQTETQLEGARAVPFYWILARKPGANEGGRSA